MSNSQHRCVFVGNIPYDATEEQLIQICEEVGPVVSFRLVLDRDTGKPKGYGFCEFRDEETALSARRNLQGYEINGRQLRVDFAENEKGVDRNREQGRGGPGFTSTYDSQKQGSGIRTIRDPSFYQPVGIAVAAAAASVMAGALGGSQVSVVSGQPTSGSIAGRAVGTDPLTIHLAGMSKHQLFEIISQMKGVIQQNQQQARQTLVTNPQLTKALFQAQIILGLVQPSQLISNLQPLPQKIPIPSMSQPLVLQQHAVPLSQGSQTRLMQLHSVQTSPMQLQPIQTVQQGKMLQSQISMMQNQIPQNASIHSQLKGFQQSQSQIPTSHSSQSVPFQHPMQSLQQSQKGPIQPVWQNVSQLASSSVSIQPPIQPVQPNQPFHPLTQQSQPSSIQLPPEHMQQPISQLNRPPGPQVHPVQSMGFQLPPIQQQTSSHQSAVQHRGIPQSSMGMQHQPLPPLPSQPPLQQLFQMSNSSAELGASGITQSGFFTSGSMLASSVSMPLGGHQQVRGPAIEGIVTRPISSVTWAQIPQSGTVSAIAGVPHSSPPLVMAGNGSCNSTSNGDTGSPAALAPDGPSTSGAVIQSSSQPQQPHQTPFGLEQQKALLQQVMNLTPEQISSLPPEQRQQVIQLQQAFRS